MSIKDIFRVQEFKSTISGLESEVKKLKQQNEEEKLHGKLLESEKSKLERALRNASAKYQNERKRVVQQETELACLKEAITPEIQNAIDLDVLIREKKMQIVSEDEAILEKSNQIAQLSEQIEILQKETQTLEDKRFYQDFNLYEPTYSFASAEEYKERLSQCREQQRQMVRSKTATKSGHPWAVNGDKAQGERIVSNISKQSVLAFNLECDSIISKVRFNNFDKAKEKIYKAYDKINGYCKEIEISISEEYCNLKILELILALEYERKRQEEKEFEREQREIARENARVQKELEEQRQKLEKEKIHYNNRVDQLKQQYEAEASEHRREIISEKIRAYEQELISIDQAIEDVDYRQANERAGYVYVISNIGAFGNDVYKIGMTRRLEPQDRIDELGGASVPFRFDIHAMIFSNDAPKLETALHNAFSNKRVNMVNSRKEFFRVSLEEIEAVVKQHHDQTASFNYTANAQQFRESAKITGNNT